MITIESAKKIAQRKMSDLKILGCTDIGDKYAFAFGIDEDDIPPGLPCVCVDKYTGEVSYMTIPPMENYYILEKGKDIPLN